MKTVIMKPSLYKRGEQNLSVNLYTWALLALAEHEYQQFETEMKQTWDYIEEYKKTNFFESEEIWDYVTTPSGIQVKQLVYTRVSFDDNYEPHSNEVAWFNKMSLDPDIIEWHYAEYV